MYGSPITQYPGASLQYAAPVTAGTSLFDRTPMFAVDQGPRYISPFNSPSIPVPMQLGLQMFMPQMMKNHGRLPTQFFPQQQVFDQLQAQQFYKDGQRAMQKASEMDITSIDHTLGGLSRLITGEELTPLQRATNFRTASQVAKMMPLLSQVLGPDMIEMLHGSRGSATIFAQQMHQALRTNIDPVTGRVGYSGESTGRVVSEVFDQLYGDGSNLSQMQGLSAGRAGMLVNELQSRGLLGQSFSARSLDQRLADLPELDKGLLNRLAESDGEIKAIRKAGRVPGEEDYEAARSRISDSYNEMKNRPLTSMSEIEKLPGGEEILRAGDAQRITDRLKNLAGAVKAMRDFFGDSGNPNAPMRQIVNGLDMLTQGGLATMSPGQLETTVRRARNLAQQSGLGMEGIMALSGQNANLADKLGLDRSFAITGALDTAAFGAALPQVVSMDTPAFGAGSREEITMLDQQLRMFAAASPMANQLGAVARMVDTGVVDLQEDSELEAIMTAVDAGQTSYTFDGQQKSLAMKNDQMLQILTDASVNESVASTIFMDRFGNQEYIQKYEIQNIVRQEQAREAAYKQIAPALGLRLGGMLGETDVDQQLTELGVVDDPGDFQAMMQSVAVGVSTDWLNMDSDTSRDTAARSQQLDKDVQKRLREQIAMRMPDASEAEIDSVMTQLQPSLPSMGEAVYASIGTSVRDTPYRTPLIMRDTLSSEVLAQANAQKRQADATAAMQTALSSLGTAGPGERLIDAIQKAGPDTEFMDLFLDSLGGVELNELEDQDGEAILSGVTSLLSSAKEIGFSTPTGLQHAKRNASMIKALLEGGELARIAKTEAETALEAGEDWTSPELIAQLHVAIEKGGTERVMEAGYLAGADVSTAQIEDVADKGRLAGKLLGDKSVEAESAITGFLENSTVRGQQLLNDDVSLAQLGRGGLETVQDVIASSRNLQNEAAARKMTVQQYIDSSEEARSTFHRVRNTWQTIEKIREYGRLPGTGSGPNAARLPRTDREKSAAAAAREFSKEFSTSEERAVNVADRLIEMQSEKEQERLRIDSNRQQLIGTLQDGDRSITVDRALRAHQNMYNLAFAKGLYGDKKDYSSLTDDERDSVVERLEKAKLTDSEQADFKRLRSESEQIDNYMRSDVELSSLTPVLEKLIQSYEAATVQMQTTEDKKLDISMSGKIEIHDDGDATMTLNGSGLMNAATGLV